MTNIGTRVLAERNLDIRQGADCTWVFAYSETLNGVIVTNTFAGWTARSQIRSRVGGDIWATVTPTIAVASNKITLTFHLAAADTEPDDWNTRNVGAYDVELIRANGAVIPLAAGRVIITHDVTRT